MEKIAGFVFWNAVYVFPALYLTFFAIFQPYASVYTDNTSVSAMASWGEPHPYLIHLGYLFGCLIAVLRTCIPQVEWFATLVFLVNLAVVAIWAHCVVKPRGAGEVRWSNIAGMVLLLAFMVHSTYFPYYSLTCSVGMAAGLVWMLQAQKGKRWGQFITAMLFLAFSANMRFDSCISLLPACALLAVFFVWTKQYRRVVAPLLAVPVICAVYLAQPSLSIYTPWEADAGHVEQNLNTINNARLRFYDYDDRLDSSKRAEYDQLGFTWNDQLILSGSSYQLEKRSEPGWFEKLLEIRKRDNGTIPGSLRTLGHRLKLCALTTGCGLLYFYYWLVVAVLAFVPKPKTWKDPRIVGLIFFLGDAALLSIVGRCSYTQMGAVAYMAVPVMLWGLREAEGSMGVAVPLVGKHAGGICVAGVLAAVLVLVPQFSPLGYRYPEPGYREAVCQECARHPECNYYVTVGDWARKLIPVGSLRSADYKEIPNLLPDKDYLYLAPSVQMELRKRGIPSDLTILLQGNTRFIYKESQAGATEVEQRLKYWDEHHGIKLHLEKAYDLVDGYAVYKAVREPGGDDVPLKPAP